MGRITSNIGLITGTNISGTVDQLLAISARPRDNVVANVVKLRSRQVVLSELTALVVGVQLQGTRIGSASNISTINVSSSKSDVLSAKSTGSPLAGQYTIQSLQTAQSSTQISSSFTSSTAPLTAGDITIRSGGFLDESASLDSLRGGAGIERGKIEITNRNGDTRTVDLRFAATIADVAAAINQTDGLKVNAIVDGDRLKLADLTGQSTSNLRVVDSNGGRTAVELGFSNSGAASDTIFGDSLAFLGEATSLVSLRDGRGLNLSNGDDLSVTFADGSTFNIDLSDSNPPARLGELIEAINSQSNGKLNARIANDGVSLEFQDTTTGSAGFTVSGKLADSLGLTGKTANAGVVSGDRIESALQGKLLNSLNGGKGVGSLGTVNITNRAGTATTVDLSASVSLQDAIATINNSSSGVTATLNKSKTGIVLQDVSGSTANNLQITNGDANNAATKLKIEFNDAKSTVETGSLDAQFVSRQTKLSTLNQGRGVRAGGITITNSAGQVSAINLKTLNAKTVGDVIDAVNNLDISVTAKLNDAGDGFFLVDNAGGSGVLNVADSIGSNAATDLGLSGTATSKTIDGQTESAIESKQNATITVAADDTLETLVTKINGDNGKLNASLLNVGGGSVRLLLNSRVSGTAGRLFFDGEEVGISASPSATARDALISINPSEQNGGTLLSSASNEFAEVLPGLSFTINGTSSEPVTIKAEKSFSKIETNLKLFVDQYNKVVEKLAAETKYDPITNSSGSLFGSNEAIRTEQTLSRLITGRASGTGNIKTLAQLGIGISQDGKLSLDNTKLNDAIAREPESVQKFLSDEKFGFAARSKNTLESLVGIDGGLLVNRNAALQRQVESNNSRIDNFNIKLDRERTRLTKQFTDMELAISKIQSNFGGLNLSIYDSLFSNK